MNHGKHYMSLYSTIYLLYFKIITYYYENSGVIRLIIYSVIKYKVYKYYK